MLGSAKWDDLRIFLAVAEANSFRAAASALRVDHATVSRRMRALQSTLDVRLLDRTDNGYVLTSAGEDMLHVARSMRDQLEALDFRISGRDARLSGVLRITLSEGLSTLLAPDLAGFCAQYPDIRVEIVDLDDSLNLTRREADIAVRFSSSPPEQLVGRRVWSKVPFAPYAATRLAPRLAELGSIFDAPWVDWDHAFSGAPHVKWVKRRVPEHRIAARIHSTTMLRQMVREGAGVGLMFCGFGEHDPLLTRVGEVVSEATLDLWVLTHAELRSSAKIRAGMDMLGRALQAKSAQFMVGHA